MHLRFDGRGRGEEEGQANIKTLRSEEWHSLRFDLRRRAEIVAVLGARLNGQARDAEYEVADADKGWSTVMRCAVVVRCTPRSLGRERSRPRQPWAGQLNGS